ncbi:MAG TPA: NAD(P)H-binding protein [Dermatophilaceae bacterium]|nr:NAD(P)H-binding protein [Dermatophilaceae bacterium]
MSSQGQGSGMPRASITVAVAEASSPVGRAVVEALLVARTRREPWETPVALGPARDAGVRATWRTADLDTPNLARALDGVDALVWSAAATDLESTLSVSPQRRRDRVTARARAIVTSAAAAQVPRLVVVTSAMVYGAAPDNPVPLPEEAPLNAVGEGGIVGDLLAVEEVVAQARLVHPGLTITVIRPAALVGPAVDTIVTRHFEAPRLLTVKGANPAWQFCHVADLGSAVLAVIRHGLGPVVTAGSEGYLTQEQVEARTGMRRVELSASAALGTAQRLHRFGVLPAPASELALAIHPWAIDSASLLSVGWQPAYDDETCLGVLLESIRGRRALAGRRVAPKDAALGAASAAVALVGTAAVLRRARKG